MKYFFSYRSIKIIFLGLIFFASTAKANLPYYPIQFPRDDAAHIDNVPYSVGNLTEWWYYNGKLTTLDGRHFGYCIFYLYQQIEKNNRKIKIPLVYILLTDIDNKKVYRLYDQLVPITTLNTENLAVAFGKNITLDRSGNTYLLNVSTKVNGGHTINLALQLTPEQDRFILNGKTGLIKLSPNTNSYYYSRTHLKTTGYFQVDQQKFNVDSEKSLSWMDHQWGDFNAKTVRPWVWASIQLENGIELNFMGKIFPRLNAVYPLLANILMPDGTAQYVTTNMTYSPHHVVGDNYPDVYTLDIPQMNLNVTLKALVSHQAINGIWEGISDVSGTYQGKDIHGQSYTENTGFYL